jgi:flagellin
MSNLRKISEKENTEMERISSGKRILRAKDDVAGLALSTKMNAFVRSQSQATRNANDGISFVQTAEGGLHEITNILVRLRELTIQSASDTVGDKERGHINLEYKQLIQEVDRIAESTSFNGTNVINGDGKGFLNFQVGAFKNDHNVIEFNTEGNYASSERIGISGTGVESKSDALSNIEMIDGAIETISGQRADLGALQSSVVSN